MNCKLKNQIFFVGIIFLIQSCAGSKELPQFEKYKVEIPQKEIISGAQHVSFINHLKTATNKQQWMVLRDDKKIGVMNMNFDTSEFGMYIAPEKQGKGHAVWLLKNFLDFIFTILKLPLVKLEVYANNQTALRLYTKFGFKEIDKKENLIFMKLDKSYEGS